MLKNDIEKLSRQFPQSAGIIHRESYFNSAVLVPLVFFDNEYHLLFEIRASHIRQGDEVSFPGGQFDKKLDTTFTQAAVRETVEEIGIDKTKIKLIGQMKTLITPHGVIVEPVLGELTIENISELNIDKYWELPEQGIKRAEKELEIYKVKIRMESVYSDKNGNEVVLFPAKQLGIPERYHKTWGKSKRKLYVFRTDYGVIWGITAEIILEFIRLLEEQK